MVFWEGTYRPIEDINIIFIMVANKPGFFVQADMVSSKLGSSQQRQQRRQTGIYNSKKQ